jgi:hypothetical protein
MIGPRDDDECPDCNGMFGCRRCYPGAYEPEKRGEPMPKRCICRRGTFVKVGQTGDLEHYECTACRMPVDRLV